MKQDCLRFSDSYCNIWYDRPICPYILITRFLALTWILLATQYHHLTYFHTIKFWLHIKNVNSLPKYMSDHYTNLCYLTDLTSELRGAVWSEDCFCTKMYVWTHGYEEPPFHLRGLRFEFPSNAGSFYLLKRLSSSLRHTWRDLHTGLYLCPASYYCQQRFRQHGRGEQSVT